MSGWQQNRSFGKKMNYNANVNRSAPPYNPGSRPLLRNSQFYHNGTYNGRSFNNLTSRLPERRSTDSAGADAKTKRKENIYANGKASNGDSNNNPNSRQNLDSNQRAFDINVSSQLDFANLTQSYMNSFGLTPSAESTSTVTSYSSEQMNMIPDISPTLISSVNTNPITPYYSTNIPNVPQTLPLPASFSNGLTAGHQDISTLLRNVTITSPSKHVNGGSDVSIPGAASCSSDVSPSSNDDSTQPHDLPVAQPSKATAHSSGATKVSSGIKNQMEGPQAASNSKPL